MSLWRYLDLAKFTALLQTRSLHFCRADKLGDPFEGSYPLKNIDDFGSGKSSYSSEKWKKFIAISCWYDSNVESDAMWRLYTCNNQGIAIRTSWEKLEELVCPVENLARLEKVKYIDFLKGKASISSPSEIFEYKREAYGHEHEVRVIVDCSPETSGFIKGMPILPVLSKENELEESGKLISMDLSKLIEMVVVSPYSESWFLEIIKDLVSTYGLDKDIVKNSVLKADPIYAKI